MPDKLSRILTSAALSSLFLYPIAASARESSGWTYGPEDDRVGRIYYYERSNLDGSMDERVSVFRKSATEIEVYKENGLCQRAALVTAVLDLDTLTTGSITGGSLQPEARHSEFAFLETDPGGRRISLLVQLPDMEIRDESEVLTSPWALYDFDFASLTVSTPHIDQRQAGFSFGMALLWPDPNAPDPFTWMGDVAASYLGVEDRLGVASEHYRLTGSALAGELSTGQEGELWLDSREGHIVDVVLPMPNHPGYRDFRLRLLKASDGGEPEWTALLKKHFQGCS